VIENRRRLARESREWARIEKDHLDQSMSCLTCFGIDVSLRKYSAPHEVAASIRGRSRDSRGLWFF